MTMNDKIPLVDLKAQYRRYKTEFDTAVQEQIDSCGFIGGPIVKAFADEFAEFCGGGYVSNCGNGSDALEIALWGLLGWGDGSQEIIIPSHTFIATAEAVTNVGYKPIFVDLEPKSYLMSIPAVERAITAKTRAIIPVHLYGQMIDMPALMKLAERHGLVVLEDAAQAHGAAIDGLQPGMLGHAATFSFFPGKNLGAWGDAGAVFTRDADLAERMTMLANHGRVDKYRHQFEGFSSRMDGIQAAILRAKLRHLSEWNDQRRQAAAWYDVALGGCAGLEIPTVPERARHVFHLYVVRVPAESRDAILKFMQNAGIGAGIHYPVPLHEQPAYKHLGMQPDDLPETSITAKRIISLPIYPEITEAQVARVAGTLIEALKTQDNAVA